MPEFVDIRAVIKAEWLKGTPEAEILRIAEITHGELYRILSSMGVSLDRDRCSREGSGHLQKGLVKGEHAAQTFVHTQSPQALPPTSHKPIEIKREKARLIATLAKPLSYFGSKRHMASATKPAQESARLSVSLKAIERLRDHLSQRKGAIEIKILPPIGPDYYLITYNEEKREAIYFTTVSSENERKTTVEETSLNQIFNAMNMQGTAARVQIQMKRDRVVQWFDTSMDSKALAKMCERLIVQ